jgi:chromosome segregation ATPase
LFFLFFDERLCVLCVCVCGFVLFVFRQVEQQAAALTMDSQDDSLQSDCADLTDGLAAVSETMQLWSEEREHLVQWRSKLTAEKHQVTAEISRAKGGINRSGSRQAAEDKLNALYQRQSTIDFHESLLRELNACQTSAEQWDAVRVTLGEKLDIHRQRVHDTMAALATHVEVGDRSAPVFENSSVRFTLVNEMERMASRQSSISVSMKEAHTELLRSLEDFTEVLAGSTELETAKDALHEAMSRIGSAEGEKM